MSYSIIFKTKVVKLNDGRILYMSRQGCNNDNEGREKYIFNIVGIKSVHEFISYAESFMDEKTTYKENNTFDLKIGSRYATYYEFGEHLLRMLSRAENADDFVSNNVFQARYCTGIELIEPYHKEMTLFEFDYMLRCNKNGRYRYRPIIKYADSIKKIIDILDRGMEIKMFVKKFNRKIA